MRRRQSSVSAERAQELWNARTGVSEDGIAVRCKLVTPMYGGGVTAGEVDKAMPIRASGIRGQLRFWWRLLYGADRNSKDVFRDECKLWGGIASSGPTASANRGPTASKVALRVACKPAAASFVGKGDLPSYVLILDSNDDPKLLEQGYAFELMLKFNRQAEDEQRSQVVECLRWWASFGGVGARTRRGLGAIQADSHDANLSAVSSDEVRALNGWMVTGERQQPGDAWRNAIGALESFRQGQDVGRKRRQGGGPGGSNWPEAEAIRRLASTPKPAANTSDGQFSPRATFGLPIVFQFKGEKHLNDTLERENHERMASPLILRPYFDGSGYRAMALLLPGWEQRISMAVKLKQRGSTHTSWPSNDDERERLAKEVGPMASRGNDPLTAFMRYFDEHVNRKRGRR